MDSSAWLALLNVLIAFAGVSFVGFAVFEWRLLRALRRDMRSQETRIKKSIHANLKASHRVLASYAVKDAAQRIALLESAIAIDADAYNAWNALGYAHIEAGGIRKAVDAFSQAVFRYPEDKAGYCDLAYAHTLNGDADLALKYLRKAFAVDASVLDDIRGDARLAEYAEKIRCPNSR
jgi:tetratricopeptide (TPR) repeat protein